MRLFSVVSGKLIKKLKACNKEMKQQPPIISPVVLIRWLLKYTRLTVSSFYDLSITCWVAVIQWWLGDNQEKKVHVRLPPPVSQFGSQLSDDDTELLLDTRKNLECCELSVEPTNYQKRVRKLRDHHWALQYSQKLVRKLGSRCNQQKRIKPSTSRFFITVQLSW